MFRPAQEKEIAPAPRRTCLERSGRRHVLGVIVCLGPVSESTITYRCHRYYGMSAFEVADRLLELFTIGVVETVGTNLAGNPKWDLADKALKHEAGYPLTQPYPSA